VVNGTSKESLDPEVIGTDNKCALGQWLYGEAKQHAQLPEYAALIKQHAEFHKSASEVLRLALAGQAEMAKASLTNEGPFVTTSVRTITAIRRLQRKVEKP
jgi:hypothetical protein